MATVAGCGSGIDDAATSTPTSTTDGTPQGSKPAGSLASFGTYLDNRGVDVRRLREEGDVVTLRYVPGGDTSDELSAEIGTIAGGYLREVEAGWTATRLEAVVLDGEATVAGWHVRSAWVTEYRRGEISGEELSVRILKTLERHEGSATD